MKKFYKVRCEVFDDLEWARNYAATRGDQIVEITEAEFCEIANTAMQIAEAQDNAYPARIEPRYTQENFGIYDHGWPRRR